MTLPRAIHPGRSYFITRRCTQRQFLLRPDRITNGAFLYCLAEAASRFGIEVICALAMSGHYHAVVHDPEGELPAFLGHFHKILAKTMNARWGRWENFFSAEPCCAAECIDAADVFDKMIYTLTNPVKDHLVDKAHNWPGASSLAAQLGDKQLVLARPRHFFAKEGSKMPEEVSLRFARPEGFGDLSHAEWADEIRAAIAQVEVQAAAERRETGRRIVGRRAIRERSAFDRPSTSEPRRNLRPRIACRDERRRIEAIRQHESFIQRYREALAKLRDDIADVLFPAGTYLLRVRGLVCCEPSPAPS